MNFAFGICALLCLFAVVAVVPVLIGVYVYRDAKSRGLNAPLWTIVAVFAPSFIGLIIYLLIRSERSVDACPGCGAPVNDSYTLCPKCGRQLKARCSVCGIALHNGWQVCPGCGAPVPDDIKNAPEKKPDKKTGKLLICLIAIPVVAFLIMLAVLSVFTGSVSTSTVISENLIPRRAEITDSTVNEWLSDCDSRGNGVYALVYKGKSSDNNETCYIIYSTIGHHISFSADNGGIFTSPRLEGTVTDILSDAELIYYCCYNDDNYGLRIRDGSKTVPVDIKTSEDRFRILFAEASNEALNDVYNTFYIKVSNDIEFYEVAVSYTLNGDVIGNGSCVNANGSRLKGNVTIVNTDHEELSSVEINLLGEYGQLLASAVIDNPGQYEEIEAKSDGNGGIVILKK